MKVKLKNLVQVRSLERMIVLARAAQPSMIVKRNGSQNGPVGEGMQAATKTGTKIKKRHTVTGGVGGGG